MRRLLPLAAIALALMGAGCGKANPNTAQQGNQSNGVRPQQATTTDPYADYVDPETTYAKQALLNLTSANSFHSRMVIPGVKEDVVADLIFVKDQAMRGTLSIPSEQGTSVSEVYLSAKEVLYKQGSNAWQNISGSEEAAALTNSLKGSFSFGDDGNFILNGSEQYLGKSSGSGCTAYRFRQVTDDGHLQAFTVCISDKDLPTFVEIDTKTSRPIRIDYSDVNAINTVERPQV
ncbi:MAG: hypothetical protein U0487_02205 [Patescibacteria group bacterium]